jgi:hypothetical protein
MKRPTTRSLPWETKSLAKFNHDDKCIPTYKFSDYCVLKGDSERKLKPRGFYCKKKNVGMVMILLVTFKNIARPSDAATEPCRYSPFYAASYSNTKMRPFGFGLPKSCDVSARRRIADSGGARVCFGT